MKRPPLRLAIPFVVAAVALIFEVRRFISLIHPDPGENDFRLYYVAAQAGMKWGWSHMYDPDRLEALSRAFGPHEAAITSAYTYANPPLLAWLVTPLTPIPLEPAFYLWTAANLAAFVVAWRVASPGAGFVRWVVLLGSLAIWPTVYSLERGQPVLIVCALAIGCWWMASHGRNVEAGLLLGLAFGLKPQDVALLPVVLLICGHTRATAWWAATSTALGLLFALVLGPNGVGTYLAIVQWVQSDPQHSIDTVAVLFGSGWLTLMFDLVMLVITVAGVWRHRKNLDLAFAIGLVGAITAGPHVLEYDLAVLVVAAWLALRQPASMFELAWLGIGVVAAQALSLGNPVPMVLWQPIQRFGVLLKRPLT